MMTKTITAANSVLLISVTGLFPVPIQLQGFAADDVFEIENVASVETMMGVDGRLSGGFTPAPVVQNIMLQADSPSNDIMEAWYAAQQTVREAYTANGSVVLPATRRAYALRKGFLTGYTPAPPGKKVLQPRRYTITWEAVSAAPVLAA
jgi:hypothetical protein